MPKKIIILITAILMSLNCAFANPYYDLGLKYLNSYQYSSAIEQFRNSLRQYPSDYNSRVGLINSYLARATYYNNTAKDYQKALNDLRSAIFYIRYYDDGALNTSLQTAGDKTEANIKELTNILKANTTPDGLLASAKTLRNQSELPSSFWVYQQLMGTKYDKEATIASADILRILKNPSRAIVYYNKILDKEPNNHELMIKVGECYQDIGDAKNAAELFNKALAISKNSEAALDNLEKIWRKQIYLVPSDAEAHANLGVIYQQKGNLDGAMEEYLKAEKLNPDNLTTKMNLGTLYQTKKQYDNAIALYDRVLYTDTKNINARLYKAQCLEEQDKKDMAIVEYKRVLAFDPNNQIAKSELLKLAYNSDNPEEVISALTEGMTDPVDKAKALYKLAYDLHKEKKYEDAKKYYLLSLELDSNQPDAYLNLSDVYVQLNEQDAAMKTLKDASIKYPSNVQIAEYFKNLKIYDNQKLLDSGSKALIAGDYQKALSVYKSIEPQNADSLLGIASTYQAMDNNTEAIEYYKKALSYDPRNPEIAYYIASAYVAIGDFTNAKSYVTKVLSLNPAHQNGQNLQNYIQEEESQQVIAKALDFYNNAKYKEAYDILTMSIAKSPTNAVLYYYRGLVLDAQKQYQPAINDYKNTVKFDENFDLAYYSLGVDYDMCKNYKEAYSNYIKYLKISKEQNDYTAFAKKRIEELKKYVPNIAQTK